MIDTELLTHVEDVREGDIIRVFGMRLEVSEISIGLDDVRFEVRNSEYESFKDEVNVTSITFTRGIKVLLD